ncbi:MAG: hypothetical protein HQK50_01230 [Oligoflexia bacterium]|nr:hypothetical protein [Oligoflexia bacterium]MBF0364160.1 hypothetical protein [Oligoflexia bacterium]
MNKVTIMTAILVVVAGLFTFLNMAILLSAYAGPEKISSFFFIKDNFNNSIVLYDSSCEKLERHFKAINKWRMLIEKAPSSDQFQCYCERQDECHLRLSHSFPEGVIDHLGSTPACDGPNCHNAAMAAGKIVPSKRYMTAEEVSFWLNSPLCKRLSLKEKLQPGDILEIRSQYKERGSKEVHSFTYISDDLVYTKNGYSKRQSYVLESLDNVLSLYQVDKDCFSGKVTKTSCSEYVDRFRCEGLENYLQKQPQTLSPEVQMACTNLDHLECTIGTQALCRSSTAADTSALLDAIDINISVLAKLMPPAPSLAKKILSALRHHLGLSSSATTSQYSPLDRFMVQSLQHRMNSIKKQKKFVQ